MSEKSVTEKSKTHVAKVLPSWPTSTVPTPKSTLLVKADDRKKWGEKVSVKHFLWLSREVSQPAPQQQQQSHRTIVIPFTLEKQWGLPKRRSTWKWLWSWEAHPSSPFTLHCKAGELGCEWVGIELALFFFLPYGFRLGVAMFADVCLQFFTSVSCQQLMVTLTWGLPDIFRFDSLCSALSALSWTNCGIMMAALEICGGWKSLCKVPISLCCLWQFSPLTRNPRLCSFIEEEKFRRGEYRNQQSNNSFSSENNEVQKMKNLDAILSQCCLFCRAIYKEWNLTYRISKCFFSNT